MGKNLENVLNKHSKAFLYFFFLKTKTCMLDKLILTSKSALTPPQDLVWVSLCGTVSVHCLCSVLWRCYRNTDLLNSWWSSTFERTVVSRLNSTLVFLSLVKVSVCCVCVTESLALCSQLDACAQTINECRDSCTPMTTVHGNMHEYTGNTKQFTHWKSYSQT